MDIFSKIEIAVSESIARIPADDVDFVFNVAEDYFSSEGPYDGSKHDYERVNRVTSAIVEPPLPPECEPAYLEEYESNGLKMTKQWLRNWGLPNSDKLIRICEYIDEYGF